MKRRHLLIVVAMGLVCFSSLEQTVLADEPSASTGQSSRLSFINDISPILTKSGCNAGPCHAKAGNGQNGFRLSLLGFEAAEDYEHIVKESRGRRISPLAPEQSLLLTKATNTVPHTGGKRIDINSESYQRVVQWITEGMYYGSDADAKLESINVEPKQAIMKPHTEQQLKVLARFSDGSQRDVTSMALFEPNHKSMADVNETGLVKISDIPGNVVIMVRYQGVVNVFTASIPLGAPVENLPASKNFIDELVFSNLKRLGIPPSEVCDDATFLRRASVDIAGQLPTVEETEAFLADTNPDKRDLLIDTLLSGPGYADYFANKWGALLKNRRDAASDKTSNFAFHSWLRDSLLENKPYNDIVTELLGATGDVVGNPPVAWYKRVKQPEAQLEDIAQLFLGVRMQCAQCHHHPFERWSQDDYYRFGAFFSQIGRTPTATPDEDIIFHKRGLATSENKKTRQKVTPAALGAPPFDILPDEDPRLYLANWMSEPDNPFFAKALVNRYWKHFFKRGLIDPEDDIRDTNPPSNPELLDALAQHFVKSGYDLKELVRVITQSKTYQLSSVPNAHNVIDEQNYSRYYPRHLTAEVLLDSIDQVTGGTTNFADMPAGTRAVSLPDNSYSRTVYFLNVFGRPGGASVCECERVDSSSLSQSLHLMNSQEILGKMSANQGQAFKLSTNDQPVEANVRHLYLALFSRGPKPEEIQVAESYLAKTRMDDNGKPLDPKLSLRKGYEDLLWALINTKEFRFNH
ncbi:MAG TPA: DUF1549 and DUF1553 domain-containing protein [Planctomicrobium sp.]|nr:DUF1549 and DUF1553 domain-containing protein [Planctomicrobium sp.]